MSTSPASTIIQFILKNVASGALGELGSTACSWILNAILGVGPSSQNQQVLDDLNTIEESPTELQAEVAALSTEVQNLESVLVFTEDWDTLIDRISQPVSAIETMFTTFSELTWPTRRPRSS